MEGRKASHLTMPIDKESVPPPTIGKIGPYTVFVIPKPAEHPLVTSAELVSPPVQPPPPHFDKPTADEDRSFWGFFKDAVNKAHCAHSSLDDHMARWLGLNQSKYQWALDDYYESKGLEKGGLKAKECLNKQQQQVCDVHAGISDLPNSFKMLGLVSSILHGKRSSIRI